MEAVEDLQEAQSRADQTGGAGRWRTPQHGAARGLGILVIGLACGRPPYSTASSTRWTSEIRAMIKIHPTIPPLCTDPYLRWFGGEEP